MATPPPSPPSDDDLPCSDDSSDSCECSEVLSSSTSDVPTSKSDDEPEPNRVKVEEEECEGWDRWGEKDYLIYSYVFLMSNRENRHVKRFLRFLEDHVRKSRGFDIDVCPPTRINIFYLLLPPDVPIREELKDFPRILHPTAAKNCLELAYALAKSSVEFQNEEKGSNLEFVKVVKAYTFNYLGCYYYITLVALDKQRGDYRKCQTRVFTALPGSNIPRIRYGVDSFWVRGKVDAALAARPEPPQSWPSHWELTRLREDEMRKPYPDGEFKETF